MLSLLIKIILIINCVSFVLYRYIKAAKGGLVADFVQHINDPQDTRMTYLIAGNLNQPEAAFEFMRDLFGPNYTYVRFKQIGWYTGDTAQTIMEDVLSHNYQARIFTISVGDHVARYLANYPDVGIEVYAINPCSRANCLRKHWRSLLTVVAPLFEFFCHALGWLSVIPIIPTVGGRYSLILLADQYLEIVYDETPPATLNTAGVILSKDDFFLNNDAIKALFCNVQSITVEAGHGDTVGGAQQFRAAVQQLITPPNHESAAL